MVGQYLPNPNWYFHLSVNKKTKTFTFFIVSLLIHKKGLYQALQFVTEGKKDA